MARAWSRPLRLRKTEKSTVKVRNRTCLDRLLSLLVRARNNMRLNGIYVGKHSAEHESHKKIFWGKKKSTLKCSKPTRTFKCDGEMMSFQYQKIFHIPFKERGRWWQRCTNRLQALISYRSHRHRSGQMLANTCQRCVRSIPCADKEECCIYHSKHKRSFCGAAMTRWREGRVSECSSCNMLEYTCGWRTRDVWKKTT